MSTRACALACVVLLAATAQEQCSGGGCPGQDAEEAFLMQVTKAQLTTSEAQTVDTSCPSSEGFECPSSSSCAVPELTEEDADRKAAKLAMNAGKEASKLVVKGLFTIGKEVFKLHPAGVFVGSILEGALGAFFPTAPSGGPCSTVSRLDHGKCLWQLVEGFVGEYVDRRLDELQYRMFAGRIAGVVEALQDIEFYANQETKTTLDFARNEDTLGDKLLNLCDHMQTERAHFIQEGVPHATAAYYAQWASLHIAVRAATYTSSKYRTEAFLKSTIRLLDTYLYELPLMVEEAKADRLAMVKLQYNTKGIEQGKFLILNKDRPEKVVSAKDGFASCEWETGRLTSEVLPFAYAVWTDFGTGGSDVTAARSCPGNLHVVEQCRQEHEDYVSQKQDTFWQSAVLDILPELRAYKEAFWKLPNLTAQQVADWTQEEIDERNGMLHSMGTENSTRAEILKDVVTNGLIR